MNVKNLVLSMAACALAASAFAVTPGPGNNASAAGNAGADISCSLSITNTDDVNAPGNAPNADLEFGGYFLDSGSSGDIVLGCNGTVGPLPAGIHSDPDSIYSPSQAAFDVDGEDGRTFQLEIVGTPGGVGIITVNNGSVADPEDTLIIDDLTVCAPVVRCSGGLGYTLVVPGQWTSTIGGTAGGCHCNDFDLGGTLNVEVNSNGRYTGTFSADVIYT